MYINLYTCSDDSIEVNKTLTPVAQNVTIQATESLDLINPIVVLAYNQNYLNSNYVYLSDFNRYYFIRDVQVDIGKRIVLTLDEDYLYTWRDSILSSTEGVVLRAGYTVHDGAKVPAGPTYFPDSKLPLFPARENIYSKKFSTTPFINGSGIDNYNYILTVLASEFATGG